MIDAARNDVPHEGFLFGGGSYAWEHETVSFVIDLTPGDWHVSPPRAKPGTTARRS